nr:immunoglobulin heavy chain junction region [Mus musculus]MBK4195181.1 immunoglobulin heavy chain junction region [Mus musculus]MBK4195182.1 immunoglobulin heavy chain junction region [Mus musculus]
CAREDSSGYYAMDYW